MEIIRIEDAWKATVGGSATLGLVAEYWSDDIGVERRLAIGTGNVSVRLAPKWRVGVWDDGEASWRMGAEWFPGLGGAFAVFHGVELARVTDGGHVIGGSYNLPLFVGGWRWPDRDEIDPMHPR